MISFSNKSKQPGKQRKLLPGEIPVATNAQLTPEELKKHKLLLEEMSGLADQFVSNGELDIYQETYERLKSKLDRLQTTDSSFDMYGDSDVTSSINNPTTTTAAASSNNPKTILWEYTNNENSPENLQGPFTTEQMIRLTNTEGKLDKDKVRCRRIGTEQFYSIKRIDFDLYLD
jgi:CD2 antigen cytoplasmic tail-binding protein 2